MNDIVTIDHHEVAGASARMPQATHTDAMLALLVRAADPASGMEIDRMREVWGFHKEIREDEARVAFADAFAEMQGQLPLVAQGGYDDHKKISYSRLEDVLAAARPAMQRHGFSIGFDGVNEKDAVVVTGTLTHRLGHSRSITKRYPIDTGPGRSPIQALGSSETYGRRYIMLALLNIASDKDDDGRGSAPVVNVPSVTPDQAAQLRAMVESTGTDLSVFLAHAKASSVEAVPARDFASNMALLRRKLERQGSEK